jgi:hypothetical protein
MCEIMQAATLGCGSLDVVAVPTRAAYLCSFLLLNDNAVYIPLWGCFMELNETTGALLITCLPEC